MPRVSWVLIAALVIAAGVWGLGLAGREKAIAHARAESAQLVRQRDSLLAVVRQSQLRQHDLSAQRIALDSLASRLRDSVDLLESARSAAQLTVRQIRTVGALQSRLRKAFPQLGPSGWGLTTIPLDARDSVGIQYLLVPAWFAETFVIDHANAKTWLAQKNKLLAADSLRRTVSALQDSIIALESAKAEAYRLGYQSAYSNYQDLSKRYVAELRKPRFGFGSTLGLIVGAGAGIVVGAMHD